DSPPILVVASLGSVGSLGSNRRDWAHSHGNRTGWPRPTGYPSRLDRWLGFSRFLCRRGPSNRGVSLALTDPRQNVSALCSVVVSTTAPYSALCACPWNLGDYPLSESDKEVVHGGLRKRHLAQNVEGSLLAFEEGAAQLC